jgi:HK97 family phage major capsid protein
MPVVSNVLETVLLPLYKLGETVALSKELLRVNPTNEAVIRATVIADTAAFLDLQFLDPNVTAVAGLRPASVTNGATAISSTGATAAQIIADLGALVQAVTSPMRAATWIMRPQTAHTIAARLAGVGMPTDLPRSLLGIPAIVSANSPRQIALIDADGLMYADDGRVEVDVVEDATLEMSSTPTSPPVAATVYVALWTSNLVGIKVLRWVAWKRAVPGSVAYMSVSY